MFRRRFRSGLRLGLLVGVGVSAARALQGRRARAMPAEGTWAPMQATATPPSSTPPARPVDEVGEQIMEPAATEPPSSHDAPKAGSTDEDLGAPAGTPSEEDLLAPEIKPADDHDHEHGDGHDHGDGHKH